MLKITFDQGGLNWEWKNGVSWFSKKKHYSVVVTIQAVLLQVLGEEAKRIWEVKRVWFLTGSV